MSMTQHFKHIHSPARFNQKADFGNVLIQGTDVDYLTDINDDIWLMVEWKSGNTGLPSGQAICFKRLTRDLGRIKPAFHLIAHHDTDPNNPINGNNSYVSQVLFRLPNMTYQDDYIYEDDKPSLNEWLGDLSYEFRIQKILRFGPIPLWEGIPNVEDWDGVTQTAGPSAFFDKLRPVKDSYEGLV
jgi:hypothetical protein